jgi:hypothetical protein
MMVLPRRIGAMLECPLRYLDGLGDEESRVYEAFDDCPRDWVEITYAYTSLT